MRDGYDTSPVNPLPGVVWLLALPIVALEVVIGLGKLGLAGGDAAIGWRLDALQRFSFSPDILRLMVEAHQFPPMEVARLVTYPFVHGSFTHAVMVLVFILALGKMVGELFRPAAVLAIFFGAALVGACVYTALPVTRMPLIGGYPAVYGLIGAFSWILFMRLGASNDNRARAFTLIGFLLGIQLLYAAIFGNNWNWVAELAGFATGFGMSFVVGPGSWPRLLAVLRRR
ncbi:rhomboid family intramembrane serine protease [Phaeovulum sp. W22_SRMD_FR3]|uniref:rhomboid family intramembrane serine protease n=1 Tax=Phaeovulum sp. W22_SRMD_FR3 TaxID=3240274 RepID=UPI003F998C0D